MQQRPPGGTSRSLRAGRTQPVIPGASVPMVVTSQQNNAIPQPGGRKRANLVRRAVLKLLGLGILLELFSLFLYPLLANGTTKNAVARGAMISVFPWLPHLYWTTLFPVLVQAISVVPFFHLAENTPMASANVLLLVFGLIFVLLLLAARVGGRVIKERLSPGSIRLIFCTLIALTAVFGITFLFAPTGVTPDIFLYGLYGRMITVYHVNPYVTSSAAFPMDMLYAALSKTAQGTAPYGPVWLDMSIPVVLLARESIANIIIGFRLVGLAVHVANAVLIWLILAKVKPEFRISGTLLYAWNPVVLLLGISEMHYDVVVVLFVLLAALFFQRNSLIIGWVFVLVAAMVNLFCLLLLPLFFRLLLREARTMKRGRRFLWWISIVGISLGIVVLAYAPYWPRWGIAGILTSIEHTFLQDNALNSLDAILLHLHIPLLPALAWLIAPHNWFIFTAVAVGGLLLLGFWLVDSLGLVLLFSSLIFLALLVLLPVYWPWYSLLPLALAVSSGNRRTIILAMLLVVGAALSYYFSLMQDVWVGQALVTIGLPTLLWGWMLFFTATWQMSHIEKEEPVKPLRGWPRPSWSSRPSRPSWPSRQA